MKKASAILGVLAAAIMAVSCEQAETVQAQDPEIVLEQDSGNIGAEAGSGHVALTIKNPVEGESLTVKSSATSWLKVGDVSLEGFSFSYDANTDAEPRSARFVILYANADSKIYSLTQAGAVIPDPVITLGEDMAIDETAASYKVSYEIENPVDGIDISASTEASWISIQGCAEGVCTFTVSANTVAESRTGAITFTYGKAEPKSVNITQAAYFQPKITAPSSVAVTYQGGELSFAYSVENAVSGKSLKAKKKGTEDWFYVENVTDDAVKFYVYESYTTARSATITLSYEGADDVDVRIDQADGSNPLRIGVPYFSSALYNYEWTHKADLTIYGESGTTKNFSVTSPETWITPTIENNSVLKLHLAANQSKEGRTGKVVLSYPGANDLEFTVYQVGAPDFSIKFAVATAYVNKVGDYTEIPYTLENIDGTNYSLIADISESWLYSAGYNKYDNFYNVSASTNNTGAERKATLTVTLSIGNQGSVASVPVVQGYKDQTLSISPTSGSTDYLSQEVTFKVTPATIYSFTGNYIQVSTTASWISNLRCDSDNIVHFNVSKNFKKTSRTASITISYVNHANATYKVTQNPYSDFPSNIVDLGLPSGNWWGTCNVGASGPGATGTYFAWGETAAKDSYSWSNYAFGTENSITKYNASDGKIRLDSSEDAAAKNLGSFWCMPTEDDIMELNDYCTKTETTVSGVKGLQLTSKLNGASIFIPYTGYKDGTDIKEASGTSIFIWTSDKPSGSGGNVKNAWYYTGELDAALKRCCGVVVRPVFKL